MTTEGLLRGFFAFLFAGALALGIWMRSDGETAGENVSRARERRLSPIIAPFMLPLFLSALFVVVLVVKGLDYTVSNFVGLLFGTFLSICFYYLLLIFLLPLLRRRISATVCALLWLLPNFLYITHYAFMRPAAPRYVWRLEAKVAYIAIAVWTAGFVAVLLWKIIGHLVFRRRLLRGAKRVGNPEILNQWREAQFAVNLKRAKLRLMTSPDVASPVSIGCFRFAIRVVLPEKQYTREELDLIFRHELVHILRMDGWTKFFLAFCTAMCWFNPLMWIAMRRSAEDLELGCDELVLSEANDAERKRYAELLLRTAADERGFTSCLSASAASLRYRLENVLQPRKRFSGALIAAALFLAMFLSSGHIALAYGGDSASDEIFGGAPVSEFKLSHITAARDGGYSQKLCRDEDALFDYISTLALYKISESYSFSADDTELNLIVDGPHGAFGLRLLDHKLSFTPLYEDDGGQKNFYLAEAPDWDFLFSLLEAVPPIIEPSVPELQLHFSNPETGLLVGPVEAARQVISKVVDGEETVQLSPKPEPANAAELTGFAVTEVEFGWPIMPEYYTVTAETRGASEDSYSSEGAELSDHALPLEPFDARYRVEAFFVTEDAEFLCRFYFDVDLP